MRDKDATLKINFEELPHLPSKWNNIKFTVDILLGHRTYKGNIGNLRQLRANGILGGIIQISQFSLQERQIIRYLSYNAEFVDSYLDFFHCLPGFQNAFAGNQKLFFISGEHTLAISITGKDEAKTLSPYIKTAYEYFPLKGSRLVFGMNGCWAGINNTYLWIPGTKDVNWLRDFIRLDQKKPSSELDKITRQFADSGIDIIHGRPKSERIGKAGARNACLLAKFAKTGGLELNLLFKYDGEIISADSQPLWHSRRKIVSRETAWEKSIENEILFAGFRKITSRSGFYAAESHELAGFFFDKILPAWLERGIEFYSAGNHARPFEKQMLADITMTCRAEESDGGTAFKIIFGFRAGDAVISRAGLFDSVKSGGKYIHAGDGLIAKIPDELASFLNSAFVIIRHGKEPEELIIPRASVPYWNELASSFPEAKITQFSKFAKSMREALEENAVISSEQGDLREYQKEGVKWMNSRIGHNLNCVLADEMGLGKTIQAITLMRQFKKSLPDKTPDIVVCPSSLTENWQMEFAKFAPSLKTILLTGADRHAKWDELPKTDIVITSYSLLKRDIERHKGVKYFLLILDEAQHIKNPDTRNARTCREIYSKHRIVLSGTPMENRVLELWSLFDFLNPGMLGTHSSFKKRYSSADSDEKTQAELALRISPIILRRRKRDVLSELPPKSEQLTYCDMEPAQEDAYRKLFEIARDKYLTLLKDGNKGRFEILSLLLRLRQFCCHPSLLPDDFNCRGTPSAKMELLKELVLESVDSSHKLLVFSQFPSLLKIARNWLDEKEIAYEYLDGETTNRMERVINFNKNDSIAVFLLSIKAGGSGLNLTSADRVIIYDPWWNPAVETQAADRAHRIGQTRPVSIQKIIVRNSIEEKILSLQEKKRKIFRNIVEGAPSAFSGLTQDDIRFLFS
jgi:hypothetical protein